MEGGERGGPGSSPSPPPPRPGPGRGSRAAPLPAPPPRPRRGHGAEPRGGGRGSRAGRAPPARPPPPPLPCPARSALLPRREKGQRCPNKAIGSQELLPKITPRSPASASGPFYEGGKRHIPPRPPSPAPGRDPGGEDGWESKCLLKIEPGKGARRSLHTGRTGRAAVPRPAGPPTPAGMGRGRRRQPGGARCAVGQPLRAGLLAAVLKRAGSEGGVEVRPSPRLQRTSHSPEGSATRLPVKFTAPVNFQSCFRVVKKIHQ